MKKRISKPLNLTIPPKIRSALDAYLQETEEKPSAFVSRLLRKKLSEEGFMTAETPPNEGKVLDPRTTSSAGGAKPPTPINYKKAMQK
jgi:hypothetical protein